MVGGEEGVGMAGIFWVPHVVATVADPHCATPAIAMVRLSKV